MAIIIERIEVTPGVLHGKPHIAGTRIPIDIILGLLGDGLSPEEILKQHYPHIVKDDILACIRYARQIVEDEEIYMVKVG